MRSLGGSIPLTVNTRTSNFTAANNTLDIFDCSSGAVTGTLPAASAKAICYLKRKDGTSNLAKISPAGSDTIAGTNTEIYLLDQYDAVVLISDGSSAWSIF